MSALSSARRCCCADAQIVAAVICMSDAFPKVFFTGFIHKPSFHFSNFGLCSHLQSQPRQPNPSCARNPRNSLPKQTVKFKCKLLIINALQGAPEPDLLRNAKRLWTDTISTQICPWSFYSKYFAL